MRKVLIATVLSTQLFLVGCAGVGIVATSDPQTKLSDAFHLYRIQNRPIPAQRLIFEAIGIYQSRNDVKGLADAYLLYGDFLLSDAVTDWNSRSGNKNEVGFFDKSVTSENRVIKAREYATKALEYFQVAVEQTQKTEKIDLLSNLYYQMALASNMQMHELPGDRKKSCEFYDKSLAALRENIRRNPTAKPYAPPPFASFADMLAAEKKRVRCEGSV
jgi:tetratricopeptide (TPR) repeat protein